MSESQTDLSLLPEDAILRLPDVLRLYPVSKSHWWEGARIGHYPQPIKLGQRACGWRMGDILELTRSENTNL